MLIDNRTMSLFMLRFYIVNLSILIKSSHILPAMFETVSLTFKIQGTFIKDQECLKIKFTENGKNGRSVFVTFVGKSIHAS